jgi:hypothetical protein
MRRRLALKRIEHRGLIAPVGGMYADWFHISPSVLDADYPLPAEQKPAPALAGDDGQPIG